MALAQRQTLDLDHGRVSFRQAGSGPDLVLLHGLAGNSRTWEEQIEAFSGSWRVTAWDAPGYGESDTVEPNVDSYAATLASLLDALKIDKFVLLGHSMGGVVAGRFAGNYSARLRALVLSCTLLGRRQAPGTPLSEPYMARLKELETLSAREYGANRAKSMAAAGCAPEIVERLTGIAAETRRDGLESAMNLIAVADNTKSLASLAIPVLVLTGAEDRTVTKEVSGAVIDTLKQGSAKLQTKELPGVGHAPYLEDTAAYNAALTAFLDAL